MITQIIHEYLKQNNINLVLTESCTGGNLCGKLVEDCEGISQFLCGSLVAYQPASKITWLEVEPHLIETYTAQSQEVANQLAIHALNKTLQANLSFAIVGDIAQNKEQQYLTTNKHLLEISIVKKNTEKDTTNIYNRSIFYQPRSRKENMTLAVDYALHTLLGFLEDHYTRLFFGIASPSK